MIAGTMLNVGKVLFDTEFLSEADELEAAVNTLLNYYLYLSTTVVPLPLNLPFPSIQKARQALDMLTRRVQSMINERRLADPAESFDLLSMLIKTKDEQGNF